MQDEKKSQVSLWVGVIGIGLSLLSAFVSAAEPGGTELESLNRALGRPHLPSASSSKKSQCEAVVSIEKEKAGERRSVESLMAVCMGLPPIHADSCGLPSGPGEYFEIEDGLCVSRGAGIERHAQYRKVEARERPAYDYEDESPAHEGSDDATGAQ